MAFVELAKIEEVQEGTGKSFQTEGKNIAIFKKNGQVFALDNVCSHRGGPLCDGDIDELSVKCPWHGFEFDFKTGTSAQGCKVNTYETKIENGKILVKI